MDANKKNTLLLIVDEDPQVCRSVEVLTSQWGMGAESISTASQVIDRLSRRFYNLLLLDLCITERSQNGLLRHIIDQSPETKTIIMAPSNDREKAAEALEQGAFDLLEKPFTPALLSHSVKHAIEAQQTERGYTKAEKDLKRSRDEILDNKSRLEQLNRQLMETNNALSVIAQNIERTRVETEKGIVLKIRALILPIIEKLHQDQNLARYHAELNMLLAHVKNLTSGLATDTKILTTLTSTELRIASLIKNGLKTEEIAAYLYVSPDTVKTHRKNIRRKLNINNSMYNLRNYLGSKLGDTLDWTPEHLA
jgi:FixJ family two-component response regulator